MLSLFLGIKETALFIEGYDIVPHLLLGKVSPMTGIKWWFKAPLNLVQIEVTGGDSLTWHPIKSHFQRIFFNSPPFYSII